MQIADFCDALQSRAVHDIAALAYADPHVVTPRHAAADLIQHFLVLLRAKYLNNRLMIWRAHDTDHHTKAPLPPDIQQAVMQLTAKQTQGLTSYGYFFPVRYNTKGSTSEHPAALQAHARVNLLSS